MHHNLLVRVPRGLPRRAKTLMLLHNSISEIGRNDLVVLYSLIELNLSYNKLSSPKLHHEAFRKLRNLENLDLSGNTLHSFPLGLPRSLQVLQIKNNHLAFIPDGSLSGMDKLNKLILSNNRLKLNSAYQGAWMDLSALTVSFFFIYIAGMGCPIILCFLQKQKDQDSHILNPFYYKCVFVKKKKTVKKTVIN